MKKNIYLTIILVLVTFIVLPLNTKAKTIQQFEEEVNKYTAELREKKNRLAKNDAEVAEIKRKIADIEKQVAAAEEEIDTLQAEIDASNKEIAKKTEQSKKIIEYYQISNGENAYLEYAFGANDITDMIYRLAVVEQLTEYNDNVMKELEALIEKNTKRQIELAEKKQELKKLKVSLEAEKARIYADSSSIRESLPSIEEQIATAQANVKYYKSLGCKNTEDITACQYRIQQSTGGSVPSTNGFYRPIENGYITQGYYGYGGHLGIDMSSSDKSIAVYPIATGVVFKVYTDNCTTSSWCRNMGHTCNGNAKIVKIRHNYKGSYIYSTYIHLRSIDVEEGELVTPFTRIGKMGTTGCSTGPHLHLEITTCDWNRGGGCTYSTYERSTINPKKLISIPYQWNNR